MNDQSENKEASVRALCGPSATLGSALQELATANKDPKLAPKIQRCYEMVTKLESYLDDTASSPTPVQQKIWNDHFVEPWIENKQKGLTPFQVPHAMITGPYAGQFLQIMAEITRAKRILEIGMLTGYSAVSFAQSPYCEEMVCLEMVPYLKTWVETRVAGTIVENKLRVIIGAANDSLVKLKDEGKQFDLVFIDADKGGYINYYKYIMDNDLLSKTGAFLCDNVLWGGDPYLDVVSDAGKALKDFVQFVKEDERVTQVICPVRDGILIIKHKTE